MTREEGREESHRRRHPLGRVREILRALHRVEARGLIRGR
jgi:hypothetical protein